MAILIQFKPDSGAALAAAKQLGDAVDGVQRKAKDAGAALESGSQKGARGLNNAKQAASGLADDLRKMASSGRAFEGLSSHFERQATILERIKGPMREYKENVAALNDLYRRNAISVQEYNRELERDRPR